MRLNLFFTVVLLTMVALGSLFVAQPANLRWKAACADGVSFSLCSGGGFYVKWLEIEDDRYRFCDQCSTSTEVFERGAIEIDDQSLTLISDQGKRTEYRVIEGAGKWFLSDAKGKVYGQEWESQPRIHPSSDWLDERKPLELDAPSSSKLDELSSLEPVVAGSAESFFPQIELTRLNSDLSGSRLIQGGRDLLNTRSTRRDVESLFGPLNWKILEGPTNHGTTAQARHGRLLIRVLGIQGTIPEEARIIGFSLDK